MAASALEVAQLRRMAAEPTETTYTDGDLATFVERFPLYDAEGRAPAHADWTATYDLNAAAAEVWDEKAAALAAQYDFSADGATYNRSQAFEQARKQARTYRSRAAVTGLQLRATVTEEESIPWA